MEKLRLVDKLRENTGIGYEEAKEALEASNWDVLEAMLFLEDRGRIKKPAKRIFYTNDYHEGYHGERQISVPRTEGKRESSRGKSDFNGLFEEVCRVIDTCNNIFLEIRRTGRVFLKLPLTVLIILLIFAFWIMIPLAVIGLFFDVEYLTSSRGIYKDNIEEVNKVLKKTKEIVQEIKSNFKVSS